MGTAPKAARIDLLTARPSCRLSCASRAPVILIEVPLAAVICWRTACGSARAAKLASAPVQAAVTMVVSSAAPSTSR
jgi:hypothetical protein